jgi:hypothetical protein
MANNSQRRTLVNLSVAAGSAAMFAAAWAGIAQTDGDRYVQADVPVAAAMVAVPAQQSAPVLNAVSAVSTGEAAAAPAPRRVVIVRQSRAS